MKFFFDFLSSIKPPSMTLIKQLELAIQIKDFKQRQDIIIPRSIPEDFVMVQTGLIEMYRIKDENRIPQYFAKPGQLIIDTTNLRCEHEILFGLTALVGTTAFVIPYRVLRSLSETEQQMNIYLNALIKIYKRRFEQREWLLTMSPEERVRSFVEHITECFSLVPVGHIARFLDVPLGALQRILTELLGTNLSKPTSDLPE